MERTRQLPHAVTTHYGDVEFFESREETNTSAREKLHDVARQISGFLEVAMIENKNNKEAQQRKVQTMKIALENQEMKLKESEVRAEQIRTRSSGTLKESYDDAVQKYKIELEEVDNRIKKQEKYIKRIKLHCTEKIDDIMNIFCHGCNDKIYLDYTVSTNVVDDTKFYLSINIEVQDGLEVIEEDTFQYWPFVQSIQLPRSLKRIGKGAFFDNSLSSIKLTEGIKVIHDAAFCGCKNLLRIDVPSSVVEVAPYIFEECTSLKEVILSSSTKRIGKGAFSQCKNLTTIQLPKNLEEIGDGAFDSCMLHGIQIPPSTVSVGNDAFRGCTSLKVIYIPKHSITNDSNLFLQAYDCKQENEEGKLIILVDDNEGFTYQGEPTLSLCQIAKCANGVEESNSESNSQTQKEDALHQYFTSQHPKIAKRALHYGLNLLHLLVYFPGDIKTVLSSLLSKCPQAAKGTDKMGNTPFHHAVSSTKHNMEKECFDLLKENSPENVVHQSIKNYRRYRIWNEVKEAALAKTSGLRNFNSESGMLPFMMVAEGDDAEVNSVYELLQMLPEALKVVLDRYGKCGDGVDSTNNRKRKHKDLEVMLS